MSETYDEKSREQRILTPHRATVTFKPMMDPKSWTILAIIVSIGVPPLFYWVFEVLTIGFWYSLLVWLVIWAVPISLAYLDSKYWGRRLQFKLILHLRWIANNVFGEGKA